MLKNRFKMILIISGLLIIILLAFIIVNELKTEKKDNSTISIDTSKYQEKK